MGASNYTYNVPEQDPWTNRNPRSKEEAAFDRLDAAGVKHVVQLAMASEQEKGAAEKFLRDEATFRAMFPAYKDTVANMKAMVHHWKNVLGVEIPSLAQIEESFFALRDSGILQLDAKQVAKENQEAILRRAAEIREQRETMEFDEAEAYTMPMAELEARARGW